MDGSQDPVAGLPPPPLGAWDVPQVPGRSQVSRPASSFPKHCFCQKANHQRFAGTRRCATADKTHPEAGSTTRQGLCSPCKGVGMMERNQNTMELLVERLGRVSAP